MTFNCRIIQNDEIIFSDMNELLFKAFTEYEINNSESKKIEYDGNIYRLRIIHHEDYIIYAASQDINHIKSSKLFNTACMLRVKSIQEANDFRVSYIKEIDLHVQRLIHNLITVNAQTSQLVYSIIPQDLIKSKKYLGTSNWIEQIETLVKDDTKDAALAFVRIAKYSMQIKREIGVYQNLLNGDSNISIQQHQLHRILLNIFYVFFPDFTDRGIKVVIEDSNENVFVDYETFQVALYYLLDNAVKYIKPNTQLLVSISKNQNNQVILVLEMISVKVDSSEKDKIFIEGYSGKHAKRSNKSGQGIGMAQAQKLLSYSDVDIEFNPCSLIDEKGQDGIIYSKNKMILRFKKNRL